MSRPSTNSSLTTTVPPGAPAWVTAELIEHTIRVWQPYYEGQLTPDEALAIIINVGRLFRVLAGEGTR